MALHQSFGKNEIPIFNSIHHAATGLCFNIHTDGAKRQFALKGSARHSGGRRKKGHMFHRNLAGWRVVAPMALSQRFDHRHEDSQHPLVA